VTEIPAIVLPVGADLYAVPISWVREVVAVPMTTALATAPPLVLGLINLRGEIVPLLDTAVLLGLGTLAGAVAFAAVLGTQHGPAGLATTGLPQQAMLGTPTGPSELAGTAGTYQVGRSVAVLLDPAALLTPGRVGAMELLSHPQGIEAESGGVRQ
jgi:purine-binding chemotaxis protein CheW